LHKTQGNPIFLGKRIDTLELGRSGNIYVDRLNTQLIDRLISSHNLSNNTELMDRLRNKKDNEGLEFVRGWDHRFASTIVVLLFLASASFIIIWIVVFTNKGYDIQTTVQTGFTGGGYIITAGRCNILSIN